MKKSVSIFCASSETVAPCYLEAAEELGIFLAQNNIRCNYGAGFVGLMGKLSKGMLENGGEIVGIIPQFMVDHGWCHPKLTETIVTPDMSTRKETLIARADAIVALPGGIGTLEEFADALSWKPLHLNHARTILFNQNRFYDPLINMLKRFRDEHFMTTEAFEACEVANSMDELKEILLSL